MPSSQRAPIFAQCVWRREKNPLGARPRRLNLQPIEQSRAYVGPAPLKQSARLNAIQNQDGNVPSHRLKLREHEIACESLPHTRAIFAAARISTLELHVCESERNEPLILRNWQAARKINPA